MDRNDQSPFRDAHRTAFSTAATARGSRDTVVLIHGMLSGARSMRTIGSDLSIAGYDVIYWNYPTTRQSMRVHGRNLAKMIVDLMDRHHLGNLHFVAHSMGCIVLRLALQSAMVPAQCKVVMLAPPNSGSRLTRLPMGPLATWFPQLSELSESPDSLVNRLPEPDGVDVGVLAAKQDVVVAVDSTHLSTQSDHQVIATTHQRLPSTAKAVREVRHFLTHGRFIHGESNGSRAA